MATYHGRNRADEEHEHNQSSEHLAHRPVGVDGLAQGPQALREALIEN